MDIAKNKNDFYNIGTVTNNRNTLQSEMNKINNEFNTNYVNSIPDDYEFISEIYTFQNISDN